MLYDMFTSLDRLTADLFSDHGEVLRWGGAMDLRRERDAYVLEADLPGFEERDIDVTVDGQMLTVRAEHASEKETRGDWLVRERGYRRVVRQFSLGGDIDPDGASANYRDGVLKVVIPARELSSGRRIPVMSGDASAGALTASAASSEEMSQGKAQPAHSHA